MARESLKAVRGSASNTVGRCGMGKFGSEVESEGHFSTPVFSVERIESCSNSFQIRLLISFIRCCIVSVKFLLGLSGFRSVEFSSQYATCFVRLLSSIEKMGTWRLCNCNKLLLHVISAYCQDKNIFLFSYLGNKQKLRVKVTCYSYRF